MSKKEQRRILESCHSDPTSGHFGITKTSKSTIMLYYTIMLLSGIIFICLAGRDHVKYPTPSRK